MNAKQIVSFVGSAIVLFGCSMPIASHLLDYSIGHMFSRGVVPAGVLLVAMGVLGIYGAYRGSSILLVVAASLGTAAFSFALLSVSGVLAEAEDLAGLSISKINPKSGSAVIPIGLLIMFGASLMVAATPVQRKVKKRRSSRTSKSNLDQNNIHRTELTRARNLNRTSTRRSSSSKSIFNNRTKSNGQSNYRVGGRKTNSSS